MMKKFLSISFLLVLLVVLSSACKPKDHHATPVVDSYTMPEVADVVMYQVNPRVFAPSNSLKAITARLDTIQDLGVKAGIVINPDCPVQDIFPYLHQVDFVLLMSVFAGFGGQSFIPATLERIRIVRAELDRMGRSEVPIEVDGGIGPQNAGEVVGAGAEILVAGSAVFKAENPGEVIGKMRI
jgi:ribulose-phosphate 3-epimerase